MPPPRLRGVFMNADRLAEGREPMTDLINAWIDGLLQALGLTGPAILYITVPLAFLQSLVGIIPLLVLIMLHVSVFDIIGGMLISLAAASAGGIAVYALGRRYLFHWFDRRWGRRLKRYDKWQRYLERYGIWTVVLLRTVPIIPNNMINLMCAVSPIRARSFVWGTILGNLSFIWLFGILTSSLILPPGQWGLYLTGYGLFAAALIGIFIHRHWSHIQEDKRSRMV